MIPRATGNAAAMTPVIGATTAMSEMVIAR